jgi:hypothetical protein
MSDLEDDISLVMFSGNIYLLNILGPKTTYYEGKRSLSLLNTSDIYGQLSVLHAAARIFFISAFIFSPRDITLQPMSRNFNSDLFTFFKNLSSAPRTNYSHVFSKSYCSGRFWKLIKYGDVSEN